MANRLRQSKIYPSPNVGDLVFFETVDSSLSPNAKPQYGSAHRNTADYPNHKLVFVSPENEEGIVRWFYAADRIEQEAHNWRVSYPYAGLTTAPRFSCTFILPRAVYAPIAKGTAHPLDEGDDTPTENERFVGAKLIFERQIEVGMQEIESLYIAVERIYDNVPSLAEQLAYNFERSYPYAGLTTCPRITRTLIIPRDEYAELAIGTADANFSDAKLISQEQADINDGVSESLYVVAKRVYDEVPTIAAQEAYNAEKEFPYQADARFPRTVRKYVVPRADVGSAVIPSSGLDLGGGVLAYRKEDRFEGQMEDSRYVLVTVAHDRIPNLSTLDEATFLEGFGYQITRPYGTDDHPRITWRIPAVKSGYTPTADYTACPIDGYTGLLLTNETQEANPEKTGTVDLVRVYDSLPGPELESEIREKFADVPEGFIVERKIERVRQPVKNDAAIGTLNTDAPNDVGGAVIRTELGADGGNTVILEKGNTKLTLTMGSLVSVELDEETGSVFDVTQEIVPAGTAGSGVVGGGLFSTVRALNQYFSIKTTRKSTTLGDSNLVYDDIRDYSWPAVLQTISTFAVDAKDEFGSIYLERFGYHYFLKEPYSGPCKWTITESWSSTAQAVPTPVTMRPTAMEFDFPLTRKFRIPACLHPQIILTETIGSGHPNYKAATTTVTFPATNFTDWPSFIELVSQTPYRGGFRMKVARVFRPE